MKKNKISEKAMELLRFLKQFESGEGNYVEDRKEWQKDYTVKKLAEEIKKRRK